jgi:hypothetical protein
MPLVCLLHIEEAQALPPRQGSSPWGWCEPSDLGLMLIVEQKSAAVPEDLYMLSDVLINKLYMGKCSQL